MVWWQNWRGNVRDGKRRQEQMRRAVLRITHGAQAAAWSCWVQLVQEGKQQRRVIAKVRPLARAATL